MSEFLQKSWWMLALQGLAAVVFAILAIAWPGITLLVLVAMFAAYALLSGGVALAAAFKNRKVDKHWWVVLLIGIISLAAGVVAILAPGLTALMLVLLMGANALVTGILQIVLAVRLRKEIHNEWILILSGVISTVFGVLAILFPGAGALAMVMIVSFYSMFTGILLLTLAFKARSWRKGKTPSQPEQPGGLVGA
jgi:uncharacterized membrane protein HdeD (DUF308 family)